jgi:hypothetical protein
MNHNRPAARVKARKAPKYTQPKYTGRLFLAVAAALLIVLLLSASSARAQFPRIGISASPDQYIDNLDVVYNEEFTLYVCVFGVDDATPLDQEFSSLSWVLHQVCCGAVLTVQDVQYNPDFQHEGSPNLGVTSTSEVCVDEPAILLATLTMTITADEDEAYLAAAGPYQQPVDCDGGNPLLMAMSMTLNMTGAGSTPTDSPGLGQLKALYR